MLDTKEMKPVLQRLYDRAVEGKSGKYELKKYISKKYDTVLCFDVRTGGEYKDVIDDYYPLVTLEIEDEAEKAWMDVYPQSLQDGTPIVEVAKGKMLSLGLGVGLLPEMLKDELDNGLVTHIDIVEISQDVINLTWDYQKRPELSLIITDAWDYIKNSDSKYDTIWIDIFSYATEAVVEGPIMAEIAKRMLNPDGIVRWWRQEPTENLRVDFKPLEYTNEPCKLCAVQPHMNAYGGLCLESAEYYEEWIQYCKGRGYDYYKARKALGIK